MTLGLRAMQAGADPRRTHMLARVTATVARSACCAPCPRWPKMRVADKELARPAIRTDHPIHELADRLACLHRGAWQLVGEPHVGVITRTTTSHSA